MELSKKSELTVGSVSYVIRTELTRDASPSIQTRVLGVDGAVVFQTSQDVSSLRPLFQNTQQVFTRLETQHQDVVKKLQDGHSPRAPLLGSPIVGTDYKSWVWRLAVC